MFTIIGGSNQLCGVRGSSQHSPQRSPMHHLKWSYGHSSLTKHHPAGHRRTAHRPQLRPHSCSLGGHWLTFGSLCSEKPRISTSWTFRPEPSRGPQTMVSFQKKTEGSSDRPHPDQRKVSSPVSALGHSQEATNRACKAKKAEEPPSKPQAGRHIVGSSERGVCQGLQGPGELRTHLNLPLSIFPLPFPFSCPSPLLLLFSVWSIWGISFWFQIFTYWPR